MKYGSGPRRKSRDVRFLAAIRGTADAKRRPPIYGYNALADRKSRLDKLLQRRPEGMHAAPFEVGEIGPELFPHACLMGLEGIVSKHMETGL
jgi:bifunctional non-homologous end joining protein LigD